jgi:class 3 adenylate cyclase/TolB-like protein
MGATQMSDRPTGLHAIPADPRAALRQRAFLARLKARANGRHFASPVLNLSPEVDVSGQRVAVTSESDHSETAPPLFVRRFRAVLVADVVGYTRLMEAAELDTHARYRDLRVSVGDPIIAFHRGETVKNTGDGFIAVFESPVDAMRCAVELQREMAAREASRPSDRRIAFRMGLHWEPVIFDLNDVYGGGVNLAVRLQTIAPPGGVVVSAALLDQVGEIGELPLEDLGTVRLKNLKQPVHAYSLRLPSVGALRGIFGNVSGWAKLPAIAVLPFRTIAGAAEHAVLGDWLAEEACRSLSRSNLLAVISHWSSRSLNLHPIDLPTIRACLGVDYCVTGMLRVSSSRMVLDADLLDAASGRILWTQQFAGPVDHFLDPAAEGVAEIVAAVGRAITDHAIAHVSDRPFAELEDHRLLLAAVGLMHRPALNAFARSRELFDEVLQRAPHAAEAHAWFGKWHILSVFNGWSTDPAKDTQLAVDSTARALDINPESPFALTIDGFAHNNLLRRMDIARVRYDAALHRNPNESLAWLLSGALHAFQDEADAAVTAADTARRLSPIDPFQYYYESLSATALLSAGRFEEALAFANRSLQRHDRHVSTLRAKIIALHCLDRDDEARTVAAEILRRHPGYTVAAYLSGHPAGESALGRVAATALRAAGIP